MVLICYSRQPDEQFEASQIIADMPDGLDPSTMTPDARLDEVARLLALGYLRLRARRRREKSNDPNQLRRFGLDFPAEGSVCDTDAHADRERR